MLIITEDHLRELGHRHLARSRAQRLSKFSAWWAEHSKQLGNADEWTLGRLLEAGEREAQPQGIDSDERLFLYLAARRLMPEMSGEQYLLVMDAVFADAAREARFGSIDAISRSPQR